MEINLAAMMVLAQTFLFSVVREHLKVYNFEIFGNSHRLLGLFYAHICDLINKRLVNLFY